MLLISAAALVLYPLHARAQESVAYATVVKSGVFIVGSNNAPSGMYYQHPSADTVWLHKGPPYTRGFSTDVPKSLHGAVQYVAGGNGLFRVEHDGTVWRVTTDWRITEVLDVVTPDSDPNTVYLASAYGVWYSNDGAETWHESLQKELKPGYTSKIIIDHSNVKRLYCASYEGAFVSEDGAATWKKLEGLTVHGILVIRQHPSDANVLMAGTEDNGLYLSKDAGETWKKLESGIDHSTFYAIAFDPRQPDVIYAGGYVTGVYRSRDGGATWRRINEGLKDLNVHSIAVDPRESNRIYVATLSDGIYRTDDGVSWKSAGLRGAQVWDVKVLDR
ncbi:MAG TPA: hypothetical protein VK470_11010 [Bacteroidota bacterium]|nr:hypothetical protein [Bacteroidota bacterium]